MMADHGGRPTSPVHLKKSKRGATSQPQEGCTKGAKSQLKQGHLVEVKANSGSSNLRRSTGTARSFSKRSPGPWVPPPGKNSRGSKYSWQGASHRLDVGFPGKVPGLDKNLHQDDLSTDDGGELNSCMNKYERKIDDLLTEVGTLKNEVTLQKTMRELQKTDDKLENVRQIREQQEYELEETRCELEATLIENRTLHQPYQTPDGHKERRNLMKKLVEVEMDGQAASKQAAAMKNIIHRLREDKGISASDAALLTKQKDLLIERISDFEASNRMLVKMLSDRHKEEADSERLAEQRDLLLKKLLETEDNLQQLRSGIWDKEQVLMDYRQQVDAQQDENLAMASFQTSLESTRAHLEKQLKQKASDCDHMAIQVRTLESKLAQERIEVDHLTGLLKQAREKADHDREALKKAALVQRQRVSQSKDALEELHARLLERDTHIAELQCEVDNHRSDYDKLNKEKSQNDDENIALKARITELENIMLTVEATSKSQETAITRLKSEMAEASTVKLENETLKTSMVMIEDKLREADNGVAKLRITLHQKETLIDEYRSQMNRSRQEADESLTLLDEQIKETKRISAESEQELDKVKLRLQTRLTELAPLPELLKNTELRLQDTNKKMIQYEKRNTENTKLIEELTAKVEDQSEQMGPLREQLCATQAESDCHRSKKDSLERKVRELEEQNKELLMTVAKKEEALHQSNTRLDEKNHENTSLSRQMESLLTDIRRLNENARNKAAAKDRTSHSRLQDLEEQLTKAKGEISKIKRVKDESERKLNSQVCDLKDSLEQSHSTNRSMQKYVQFLKNSYSNMFGEDVMPASMPSQFTFY